MMLWLIVLELTQFYDMMVRRIISELTLFCVAKSLGICIVYITLVVWQIILKLANFCNIFVMAIILNWHDFVFLDFSLTVKAAPHECVIRSGQP